MRVFSGCEFKAHTFSERIRTIVFFFEISFLRLRNVETLKNCDLSRDGEPQMVTLVGIV